MIASVVWKPAGANRLMFWAGVAFAIAIKLLAFLLDGVSPDQDMTVVLIIAAVLFGAGSVALLRAVRLPLATNARRKRH